MTLPEIQLSSLYNLSCSIVFLVPGPCGDCFGPFGAGKRARTAKTLHLACFSAEATCGQTRGLSGRLSIFSLASLPRRVPGDGGRVRTAILKLENHGLSTTLPRAAGDPVRGLFNSAAQKRILKIGVPEFVGY